MQYYGWSGGRGGGGNWGTAGCFCHERRWEEEQEEGEGEGFIMYTMRRPPRGPACLVSALYLYSFSSLLGLITKASRHHLFVFVDYPIPFLFFLLLYFLSFCFLHFFSVPFLAFRPSLSLVPYTRMGEGGVKEGGSGGRRGEGRGKGSEGHHQRQGSCDRRFLSFPSPLSLCLPFTPICPVHLTSPGGWNKEEVGREMENGGGGGMEERNSSLSGRLGE